MSADQTFSILPPTSGGAFVVALAEATTAATDRELNTLLDREWRSRLTAARLIACDRRARFRRRLRDQLLVSELVYAGQGYLPQVESQFDQYWAIGRC